MNNKIYMISGLGADYRMFKNLDLNEFDIYHIEWIEPIENESITNYAKRLSSQIKDENPILIGLSFGGLVTVEIAKLIQVEKIILISSMKSKYDIPLYFRIFGMTNLQKIVPFSLLKKSNPMSNWIFGAKSDFEKILLKSILEETDITFLKWSIEKIINFKEENVPNNLIHIHGTTDKLLPSRNISIDKKIEGGGHFMVLNKSAEISKAIKEILN